MDTMYKVTVTGKNIKDSSSVRIVKNGRFSLDGEGISKALEYGMFDKFGSNYDLAGFIPIAVLPKKSNKPNVTAFTAILKQITHNGRGTVAVYHVDAQFKVIF